MKFCVIGGMGFIGSTLVKKLLKEGHEVVGIDDLSTGSVDNLPNGFPRLNKISYINYVTNIDGIFHLGIPCSSPLYRENRSLVDKSIKEFIEIMEYAKVNKVKVVWASTSSVYNGNTPPYHEDMPVYPIDFYVEARYAMERLAKVYNTFYGVKSIGLRFFSVFGPNEHSKGIYANLVSQIMWAKNKGEFFDIYGDGEGIRDFTHVNDVIRACIMAMESNISFDILNVGTGKAHTLNQIIEAIGMKNIRYTTPPGVEGFRSPDTLANMEKTKRVLGFEAQINVIKYLKGEIE